MLPFRYMAATMLGSGLSGILCDIIRGITLVTFKSNPDRGAFVFFFVAAAYSWICALLYTCVLQKNSFFLAQMKKFKEAKQSENES
jgi:fructose-specific phosphotransferase system IIC component